MNVVIRTKSLIISSDMGVVLNWCIFSSRIHYDALVVVRVFPDVFHLFEAQYSICQQLFLFGAARSKFLYVPGELSFELGDLKIKVTSIAWFKIHPGG